jgi:hypothetical protein
MKKTGFSVFSILIIANVWAGVPDCSSEYERGRREMGAYAEMVGIMSGTIYGHSLGINNPQICLSGNPRERVALISKALAIAPTLNAPLELDDVPTKEQAEKFLEYFFKCK